MASQLDKNATRTSVSISGPGVAVGGAPKGKPKRYNVISTSEKTIVEEYNVLPRYLRPLTRSCHDACKHGGGDEYTEIKTTRTIGSRRLYNMSGSQNIEDSRIGSRYLKPKTESCHDSCKHGRDEWVELKTTKTLASRKRAVTKSNGVKRPINLVERKKKITEMKPKPNSPRTQITRVPTEHVIKLKTSVPSKRVTASKHVNEVKTGKTRVKMEKGTKPKSNSGKIKNQKPVSNEQHVMTKTKLRQLIAEKIQQMTLDEVESVEEETIHLPQSLESESTDLTISEISVPSSNKVVEEKDSLPERRESSSNEVVEEEESLPERRKSSSNEVVEEEDSLPERRESSSNEVVEEDSLPERRKSSSNEVVEEEESLPERRESSSNEVAEEEDLLSERHESTSNELVKGENSLPERRKSSSNEVVEVEDSLSERRESESSSNEVVEEEDSLPLPESCEFSSNNNNNQVVDDEVQEVLEEIEYSDDEGLIMGDENEMEASEGYKVVICEGEDGEEVKLKLKMGKGRKFGSDGPQTIKFKDGRVLEIDGDNGPKKMKFKRGKILENNIDEESEKVTLKHQEQEKKKAEELFNSVIEETASKLAEDKKTKVGALVGAFETVISLQDDAPPS